MNKALVFIHGSGDNARIWRFQTSYFQQQGRQVEALDLPGHGLRPDIFADPEVAIENYAQAAHEIIIRELHLERPVIAGHSLGGAIALMLALQYGTELGGIILIGTGARLRVLPALLDEARQAPQQARQRLAELAVIPEHLSTAQATLREQPSSGPSMLYRDLSACNNFDVMSRLSEISLPTLIICGAEDRLTPVKYSDYLHKHIASSSLHILPQAGHYVMREQPEAVNRTIEEWLAQITEV
ncbi:alpha/beta hydrolase [Ktedonosporobacter rubrisoli]|uniref:Alpha/beta hydrolase n=1 Tax=Ktedonosporobacter rubrisoli TaxID=2509675 RepID=A0A4P6K1Q8_KTERU|nr:alpha/beta hydrolase [Ktedonosporobacter rubrisoli]QBD82117.1 alpha/beta hydrolase [Ktedonosporobacter rubrisoli]